MFRFKLSPAPRTSARINEFASHIRLPTFDCQSAIANTVSRERQPLIVAARDASVKRVDSLFQSALPRRRASVPGSLPWPTRPIFEPVFGRQAGLDLTHGTRPKQSPISPLENPGSSANHPPDQPHNSPPLPPHKSGVGNHPPTLHGPCRNRTYNLAIKSRLLCQLS